jgi:hypothetical protein
MGVPGSLVGLFGCAMRRPDSIRSALGRAPKPAQRDARTRSELVPSADFVLPAGHPLARAMESFRCTGRQWADVAAILAGSLLARAQGPGSPRHQATALALDRRERELLPPVQDHLNRRRWLVRQPSRAAACDLCRRCASHGSSRRWSPSCWRSACCSTATRCRRAASPAWNDCSPTLQPPPCTPRKSLLCMKSSVRSANC